jgi:hypothetical protein
MKKLALVFGLAVALTSCQSPEVKSSKRLRIEGGSTLRVVEFEGHEYIVFRSGAAGSLCHSESCPCKK